MKTWVHLQTVKAFYGSQIRIEVHRIAYILCFRWHRAVYDTVKPVCNDHLYDKIYYL